MAGTPQQVIQASIDGINAVVEAVVSYLATAPDDNDAIELIRALYQLQVRLVSHRKKVYGS